MVPHSLDQRVRVRLQRVDLPDDPSRQEVSETKVPKEQFRVKQLRRKGHLVRLELAQLDLQRVSQRSCINNSTRTFPWSIACCVLAWFGVYGDRQPRKTARTGSVRTPIHEPSPWIWSSCR